MVAQPDAFPSTSAAGVRTRRDCGDLGTPFPKIGTSDKHDDAGRSSAESFHDGAPCSRMRSSRGLPLSQPANSKQRYSECLARSRSVSHGLKHVGDRLRDGGQLSLRLRQRQQAWRWLKLGARELIQVVAWSILGIFLDMVWPLLSAALIDRVVLNRSLDANTKLRYLGAGAVVILLVFLLNAGLGWLRQLKTQIATSKLQIGLRRRLYRQILRLKLSDLQDQRTGTLLSHLSSDVEHTANLVQLALLGPLLSSFRLLVTLSLLFALDVRIAAAVCTLVPALLFGQMVWARKVRWLWAAIAKERQNVDARVSEVLHGIRVVRGFHRERREELAHAIGLHAALREEILAVRTRRAAGIVWDLIVPMTQILVVCFGGYLVVRGRSTLGTLIAFQGLLWRLLEPVQTLIRSIYDTQRGMSAMDRVFGLLELGPEKLDAPGARPFPERIEEIRFQNVGFAYRPGLPVLKDIDLTVRGNSVVALVGPSGSGKSTVTDLVARFYDPTTGTIALNGVDLRNYQLDGLRRHLGVVSQEVFLFDGTIRENIGYGRLDASDAEIEAAARAANAHEFIAEFPNAYGTLIGERGIKLSGGQRQRLSIARALLADPRILILDEATSNLDTESERLIQKALAQLLAHRTTFIIAHRMSTIMHADLIVVLDRGRIVELGRHDELLANDAHYARMVGQQRESTHCGELPLDWSH